MLLVYLIALLILGIPVEKVPAVLQNHMPVCWDGHIAENFVAVIQDWLWTVLGSQGNHIGADKLVRGLRKGVL